MQHGPERRLSLPSVSISRPTPSPLPDPCANNGKYNEFCDDIEGWDAGVGGTFKREGSYIYG